jgi:hypothetical protein
MPAQPGDLPIDSALVGGTELAQRLNRILPDVGTNSVNFTNHLTAPNPHPQYMTAASNTAAATAFSPAGNIGSTNVQAALVELDNEKMSYAGGVFQGSIGVRGQVVGNGAWATNGWMKGLALAQVSTVWWPKGTSAYAKGIGATSDNNIYFIRSTADQGAAADYPFSFGMDTGNLNMAGNAFAGSAQSNAGNALTRKDYVDASISNAIAAIPPPPQTGGVGSSGVISMGLSGNTVYTNTTGKPICVVGSLHPTSNYGTRCNLLVNGIVTQIISFSSNLEVGFSCIVPPGHTYQVTLTGSAAAILTYGIIY